MLPPPLPQILLQRPPADVSPRFFPRSALPPQVLGGEVALDDMPQVHVVRVGTDGLFAPSFRPPPPPPPPLPLPRGNVPGFLLLPARKDPDAWLLGSSLVGGATAAAADHHGHRRTYVLVSPAEALGLSEDLATAMNGARDDGASVSASVSASASASVSRSTLKGILPDSGVEGSGDEALTRRALCDMQRMAAACAPPAAFSEGSPLPNEYVEEITGRSITLAICLLMCRQQPGGQQMLGLHEIHCTTTTTATTTTATTTATTTTTTSGNAASVPSPLSSSSSPSSSSPSSSSSSPPCPSCPSAVSTTTTTTTASPLRPPFSLVGRVMIPNIVASRLSASVASGPLEPGQRLEVPRLTLILSSYWSGWTVSCTAMPPTAAQDCLAAPDTLSRLQPGHFDGRILPTASRRIVQRGICRHRHAAAAAPVRRRLVMTRVSRGMQNNQIVEERVFFLASAREAAPDTQTDQDTDHQPCVLAVFSTAYFLQVGKADGRVGL